MPRKANKHRKVLTPKEEHELNEQIRITFYSLNIGLRDVCQSTLTHHKEELSERMLRKWNGLKEARRILFSYGDDHLHQAMIKCAKIYEKETGNKIERG